MEKKSNNTDKTKAINYEPLLGAVIENPYKVDKGTIKTGDTFFIYYDNCFYEILIGESVRLDYMFVDFPNKKRVRINADEFFNKVPKNWKGAVRRF